jgi:hypothetical protein
VRSHTGAEATESLWRLPFSSASQSPAPPSLRRLPFSSASHSPAPLSLQRLPVSGAYHSPAPPILQRLSVSSTSQSPAPPSLQRLPISSASQSPASVGALLFGAGHLSSWSRFFTAERGLAVMRSRVGPEHLPSGRPGGSTQSSMQYASTRKTTLGKDLKSP